MSEDHELKAAKIIAKACEAAIDRKPMFLPRVMSVVEAEHYTKTSRTNLYNDIKAGLLRDAKSGGKTVFRIEDLDEYIDNKLIFGKKRNTKAANAGLARARAEKKAARLNGAAPDRPTA